MIAQSARLAGHARRRELGNESLYVTRGKFKGEEDFGRLISGHRQEMGGDYKHEAQASGSPSTQTTRSNFVLVLQFGLMLSNQIHVTTGVNFVIRQKRESFQVWLPCRETPILRLRIHPGPTRVMWCKCRASRIGLVFA